MKTTAMRTDTRSHAPAGPDALAKYRQFAVPSIEKQIRSMQGFLVHRLAFVLMEDHEAVRAVGRAWVEDALILSIMPAANAFEAQSKVEHIADQLDQWAREAAGENHHATAVRALDAVLAFERSRWGLDAERVDGTPNLH